jgi:V/A-type H+-transporting ATPase subunit K
MNLRRWMVLAMILNLVCGTAVVAAEEAAVEKTIEAVTDAAHGAANKPEATGMEGVYKTVAIAAAVAFVTAVSIVGAALAVGKIGSAALGAAAEKPELLTKAILYVALAEGLAVLGFAVAMMLMNKM